MTSNGNIVKLDVGGTVFKTLRSTLTRLDGFFKTMLETDIPVTKDESGTIFIDRDPQYFRLILNFMRDGRVKLPKSIEEVEELCVEAQYYLLTGLVELCSAELENKKAEDPIKRPQSMPSGDIVKLNVGGTVFHTTRTTLTRFNGYFRTLMNDESKVNRDENGCIFIDRPPRYFDFILSFMQNGPYTVPHCVRKAFMVQLEAEFYELHDLVSLIKNYTKKASCCGS